ncbi:rhomboid family intramembrane serine protease GlpG [Pseudoalteromonas sp.]|uniref:rhomboid family intramembrane serine protease GlpG n=1 Tax=Pseudoalteromonas sp. TaxID=53249 RepID=UPI0035672094
MKQLATLSNVRAAQGFCDYLNSINIHCELKPISSEQVTLFVSDEQFDNAYKELELFLADPNQAKYYEASWQVGSTNNGLSYVGNSLNLLPRFFKLSLLIQGVSILSIFVYGAFILGGFEWLFPYLQFSPVKIYSWLTPTIMHFSAMHLIFNLMWWMYLGDKISEQLGKRFLVLVFIVTALASNWLQFSLENANFGGLSGVVYGLLGFCWLYGHIAGNTKLAISPSIVGFMLVWLVLGFADVLFINMANWAHLGGLVAGALLGVFVANSHKKSKVN